MTRITIELTEDHIRSIEHLIDGEIESNATSNDHAYNYYWKRLKHILAKAKTSTT